MSVAAMIPATLGAAALAVTAWTATSVADHPWGTRCTVDWCRPQPATGDYQDDTLARWAAVERLTPGHRCTLPRDFDGIPAEAAGTLDGRPVILDWDRAWAEAQAGRFATYEVCAGRA